MSEVFVEMVKEQGEFVDLLKAMEKRQVATDTLIKELTDSVKKAADEAVELKKIVDAGPQRPSTNSATVVDQEVVDKLKTNSANGDDKVTKDRALMGLPPIAPTANGKGGA